MPAMYKLVGYVCIDLRQSLPRTGGYFNHIGTKPHWMRNAGRVSSRECVETKQLFRPVSRRRACAIGFRVVRRLDGHGRPNETQGLYEASDQLGLTFAATSQRFTKEK